MMKLPRSSVLRPLYALAATAAIPAALLVGMSTQANAGSTPGPSSPQASASRTATPIPSPTGGYERIQLSTAGMTGIVLQENGSTGYGWVFSVAWSSQDKPASARAMPTPSVRPTGSWEDQVVLLDSSTSIANPVPGVGRPGLRVLALTGAQHGQAMVTAQLKRSWEDTPIQTRNFLVTVK